MPKKAGVIEPMVVNVGIAFVIKESDPGFEIAKNIAEHGRICKRLSSCTCKRPEQGDDRDKCFDWVKV